MMVCIRKRSKNIRLEKTCIFRPLMKLDTRYPADPGLAGFIEYYYLLRTGDADFHSAYSAFPHTATVINVHNKAKVTIGEHSVKVHAGKGNRYTCIIQGFRSELLQVELMGPMDKVTIVFKSLAINYFLPGPFGLIAPLHSQLFSAWNDDPRFPAYMEKFFKLQDPARRSAVLEDWLMLKMKLVTECQRLTKAVESLQNIADDRPIPRIAEEVCMSTRTFNRKFVKYLGVSPARFRKVARFRHALNSLMNPDNRISDAAYLANFCDQAYLSKTYRE